MKLYLMRRSFLVDKIYLESLSQHLFVFDEEKLGDYLKSLYLSMELYLMRRSFILEPDSFLETSPYLPLVGFIHHHLTPINLQIINVMQRLNRKAKYHIYIYWPKSSSSESKFWTAMEEQVYRVKKIQFENYDNELVRNQSQIKTHVKSTIFILNQLILKYS